MPLVKTFLEEASARDFLSHIDARSIIDHVTNLHPIHELVKRINITITPNSPANLTNAVQQDPWNQSGKYALGWVFFSIILLFIALVVRLYHMWTDKIRRALHKEEAAQLLQERSPDPDYEMTNLGTSSSTNKLFPRSQHEPQTPVRDVDSSLSTPLVNKTISLVRWIFYRPVRSIKLRYLVVPFPSAGVIFIVSAALVFVILYCFIPQPLYYASISFGSPPLAIRAGMISVAMLPWIVALSMKANLISLITGIGHERLNVLHRWGGYICLILALIHTIPFYITPVWTDGGWNVFQNLYNGQYYVYGTGIAALVPLVFLCVHSLPFIRRKFYELFVVLHWPASIIFLAMTFWHCNNYLTSWQYLFATAGIWVLSIFSRLFFLNWTNYWRASWLCGEESAITLLPENAVKITIPTQVKWSPGQFVYLRMPGISIFENHPFTIASLCSDDFPSSYGEEYRDMVLVFRPFGGFTRKVVDAATKHGPYHTFQAFIDGPYGGMRRELASFDTIVLIAGGSGITALVSHLLLLIKKMRDGTAVTKQVHVIWALKRPDTAEWFKEELRICRQYAPPESVHCQFFITAAKRPNRESAQAFGDGGQAVSRARPTSQFIHDSINSAFQGIASKRSSMLVREAADGDPELEKEFRGEMQDEIRSLPQAYISPTSPHMDSNTIANNFSGVDHANPNAISPAPYFPPPPTQASNPTKNAPSRIPPPINTSITSNFSSRQNSSNNKRRSGMPSMKIEIPSTPPQQNPNNLAGFDFGFPSTPTEFQKNLMRFAFLPGMNTKRGWHTEYGRPDIPYMLKGLSREFGKRTCVFVCGPPGMREDVQTCVAGMQSLVLSGKVDEIFLHTENYAI